MAQTEQRPSHDGSPYITRRTLLAIPPLVGAAVALGGCEVFNRDLEKLPGEIIEGGTILETKEDLMRIFLRKQAANSEIFIDEASGKFDSDFATIVKSTAFLTMTQNGLSPETAKLRANRIRLASRDDTQGANGITGPTPEDEKLGIVLARDYFHPGSHTSLINGLALVSHEASHASPTQYTEDAAKQDFGVLGSFDQKGPRWGFAGVEKYPNDVLRTLIAFPEIDFINRVDEFTAETGRIEFMRSLMILPDDISLKLPPGDVYYEYAAGFNGAFGYAPETIRYADKRNHLNANTMTPKQILSFYHNSDRAGFFLALGQEIVDNNEQTPASSLSTGDIRAVGLIAFTGYIAPFTDDESKKARISDMLNAIAVQPLSPDYINQQAQLLAAAI